MNNIDITKLALSRSEIQKLRFIEKHEPIDASQFGTDEPLERLHDRGLIEFTRSDKYPSIKMESV